MLSITNLYKIIMANFAIEPAPALMVLRTKGALATVVW
jgi:hypothetical protein